MGDIHMIKRFRQAAVIAFAMMVCASFSANNATAAEIKLVASSNAAMRSALSELAPEFERSTGHKVSMEFGPAPFLKGRIDSGGGFDVVIAPDDLIKQGKFAADTRAAFVRTGLGIGVPKGALKPDISSVDAVKRTLLNAKSVGYQPESPTGIQFLDILNGLGIAQDMLPRLNAYKPTNDEIEAALQRREVEIVVSATTNFLDWAAVMDIVGGFPREIQRYVDFAAGVSATTNEAETAKALLRFLLSPMATSVFNAKGFERE
jgi:molybdate transport system substrate-binding protein